MKPYLLLLCSILVLHRTVSASSWSCSGLCGFVTVNIVQAVTPPLLVTGNGKTAEEAFHATIKKCENKTPLLDTTYLVKKECPETGNPEIKWSIVPLKETCVKD